MNTTEPDKPSLAGPPPAVRRGTLILASIVALSCVGLVWLNSLKHPGAPASSDSTAADLPTLEESRAKSPAISRSGVATAGLPGSRKSSVPTKPVGPAMATLRQTAAGPATPAWSGAQPTAEARDLVSRLLRFDTATGGLTPERATEWKQNLEQLVQQGEPGVAAIRELLTTGTDREFGDWGRTNLGFATARLALIDALAKTGSANAQTALAEALQTTLEPAEVGTLLRHLETLAPGQYRETALQAARQALAAADKGQLPGRDVAPAFEILQRYGGAEAVSELDRLSGKYLYYSAMALAALPDEAGLPLLISMARGEGDRSFGAKLVAQQMLATLAPESSAARDALLETVQSGRIAPSGWPFITSALEGRKFSYENSVLDPQPALASSMDVYHAHLVPGNQRYYQAVAPTASTPEWTSQQLALIEQLLAATKDSTATAQLQRVRDTIQARQQAAGTPGRTP